MEKPAETNHDIHELIKNRWSPRAFSEEPISEDTLRSLFESARWAPSCYNDQPWHFIVGRKDKEGETHEALYDCLAEANQQWAGNAPVLALSVARTQFKHNGNDNDHAWHDVGLAAENLVLEAMSQGIYVHQMAGFSEAMAHESFDIPEDHDPVAAFAIGYPGDPESLPEELHEREQGERSRNPLEEFVYSKEWGHSSPIL